MSTNHQSRANGTGEDIQPIEGRVVCELEPSIRVEERLREALDECERHGAELYVVWVFQPARFGSPFGAGGGAVGTFGLPAVLSIAIELADERGIAATSAVRFGEREVVLHDGATPSGDRLSLVPPAPHSSTLAA